MIMGEQEIVKDISDLTSNELLDSNFIPSIFNNYTDVNERNEILKEVLVVAKEKKVLTKVKNAIAQYNKNNKLESINGDAYIFMNITGNKKDDTTIENYVQAILNTKEIINNIKFNEFTGKFERTHVDGSVTNWTDDDDAWILNTIEKYYNIKDKTTYYDALLLCKSKISYHPIKDKIESIEWDGVKRIDRFLIDIMKCDDDVYSREVSRMIFYGGISRIYEPGCKFDYMTILVGEQGTCKSTIVDWLNIGCNSNKEIMTIEGRDGAEILRYGWICEFSELLAMIKNRQVEPMKAYVSRQRDTYRSAFARNWTDNPRHCIFIGTTNSFNFLVDLTGNRRFLPIEVKTNRGELYCKEKEIKHYIEQCWAEAKELYDNDDLYLVIPSKYDDIVNEHVNAFVEDDPQKGLVIDYLEDKPVGYKVCVLEIYTQALKNIQKKCSRVDSMTIGNYMRGFKNWKLGRSSTRFKDYGTQRYWEKVCDDDVKVDTFENELDDDFD